MTQRMPKQSALTSSSLFSGSWNIKTLHPGNCWPQGQGHQAKPRKPSHQDTKEKNVSHRVLPTSCHISQEDFSAFLILHLGVRVIISCLPSTLLNWCPKQIPLPWKAAFHLTEAERGFQAAKGGHADGLQICIWAESHKCLPWKFSWATEVSGSLITISRVHRIKHYKECHSLIRAMVNAGCQQGGKL